MKLSANTLLLNGDDTVSILKNNGRKIAYVTLASLKNAIKQNGSQVVIEYAGQRFGATRQQITSFFSENTNENTDFSTFYERMKPLLSAGIRG